MEAVLNTDSVHTSCNFEPLVKEYDSLDYTVVRIYVSEKRVFYKKPSFDVSGAYEIVANVLTSENVDILDKIRQKLINIESTVSTDI